MYLDLLDSTKSGHPISSDTKDEWWRSKDGATQDEAVQLAHAGMIMRLLYGDTIVLTHNQAVDSVAWLRAARRMTDPSVRFPYVPITWAAFNADPIPEAFVKVAEGLFRPRKPDPIRSHLKQFKLSAWAGLNDSLREQIADNLKEKQSFKFMLDGVLKDISPNLQDRFREQAEALHYFDTYLKNNYRNSEWSVDLPTVIKTSEVGSDRSVWEDLNSLRDKMNGIPSEILDEAVKKIGILNVEIRSALYEGITDVSDYKLRNRVKSYIDRFYNEKNGLSASGGRGIFSIMDQDIDTPPSDDEKQDALADTANPQEGREGKVLLQHIPEKYTGLSAVTLDDCLRILQMPDIQNNITSMRAWVRQINELRKQGQKIDPREYRILSENLHRAIDKHEYDLSKELESKISINNGTLIALVDPASISIAGGLEVVRGLVSVAINTQPWWVKAAADFGFGILGRLIPGVDEIRKRTTAAGTIRQNLRKASYRNFI